MKKTRTMKPRDWATAYFDVHLQELKEVRKSVIASATTLTRAGVDPEVAVRDLIHAELWTDYEPLDQEFCNRSERCFRCAGGGCIPR